MGPRFILLITILAVMAPACGSPRPAAISDPPPAPRVEVDPSGGTPRRGPGDLYNACERIWCLTHERNFDLTHFSEAHNGWILHDDAHGDVFVPRYRTAGPAFPQARDNVLSLCGKHMHPYWLGKKMTPVTRTGYNVALGYDRAHFRRYGTRVPPCCLNEQGWGFLHASAPRGYRFGDRTTSAEMAGSGWQKALVAHSALPSGSR